MRVFLSFDDGRSDSYEAYKILKECRLTATFHITTGFIDRTFKTDDFGKDREPLTIQQLREMHKSGMEIASHGDRHIMEESDFLTSKYKIQTWLDINRPVGFSVPNSLYKNSQLLNFVSNLKEEISYVRVGRSSNCYKTPTKIFYCLYHLTSLQIFYNLFNKHNLIFSKNKFLITSLVVKKNTKLNNLLKFIKKYKGCDCSLVLMFHSIVDIPRNQWEWSISNFHKLCQFLQKENILCNNLEQF